MNPRHDVNPEVPLQYSNANCEFLYTVH